MSGDARRALDICRRATEVAEAANATQVNMRHVDQVLAEMFSSPKLVAIRYVRSNCIIAYGWEGFKFFNFVLESGVVLSG